MMPGMDSFKWTHKTLPTPPPSPLRRWFLHLDNVGLVWIILLIALTLMAHLQLDRQPGSILEILRVIWASYLLVGAIIFLAAIDLTARWYEKTTGRVYRERDQMLQRITAQAENDAVARAEAILRRRTVELAEREREFSERIDQLHRGQNQLHKAEMDLLSKTRETKTNSQDSCSGKRRKKSGNSTTSSFKDLGIP
jgi:DNA-binding protein H-NS